MFSAPFYRARPGMNGVSKSNTGAMIEGLRSQWTVWTELTRVLSAPGSSPRESKLVYLEVNQRRGRSEGRKSRLLQCLVQVWCLFGS